MIPIVRDARRVWVVAGICALAGCATPKPDADSTASLVLDTVTPAPTAAVNTQRAQAPAPSGKSVKGSSMKSPKSTTKQRSDSILGHDRVIMPRPGNQLPVPPTKKP